MAQGQAEYDSAAAQTAADNLFHLASMDQSRYWLPGTAVGAHPESAALPAIWENMADYDAKCQVLLDAVTNLQSAAGSDLASLQGALGTVGKACGAYTSPIVNPRTEPMRRALLLFGVLALVGAGAAWVLKAPDPLPAAELEALQGDPVHGKLVFHAAGCASCHVAPNSEQSEQPVLAGGQRFVTQFGIFVAPNISPSL